MNSNTRCQLTSSSMGGSLIGLRGTDPRYPFQPLMALHNPRNIDATGSRDYEENQRVQGVRQTSLTIHDADIGDRHPSGEDNDRTRTPRSTTSASTPLHNHPHHTDSNRIEASGAASIASRSKEARPSDARRGHGQSPPPSVSGFQINRAGNRPRTSLRNGANNTQPRSDIQLSTIANMAYRLNSEIVQLCPPLQAMANYLLRLMGARREESLRWLEMSIPYLWVYMPPLLLWLRIFLVSGSDEGLADGSSGTGASQREEADSRNREREIVGTHAYAPTHEVAPQDIYRQGDGLREQTFGYADTPENYESPRNRTSPPFSSAGARPQAAQQPQSHDSYEWPDGQIVEGPRRSQPPPPACPQHLMPTGVSVDQGSIISRNASVRPNNSIDNGPSSNAQDHNPHLSLPTEDQRQINGNTPVIILLEERLPDPLTAEDSQSRIRIAELVVEQEPAPGSSSGGSRRKRGADKIDDDGVHASSESESKPKRPRRNNTKGLKPSASRAGTAAGGSDLP